jgi:uncharacterized membrane protein YeaQ/YmgE (transglycosylase-associated protein family)
LALAIGRVCSRRGIIAAIINAVIGAVILLVVIGLFKKD